jgi:hypothetical protein
MVAQGSVAAIAAAVVQYFLNDMMFPLVRMDTAGNTWRSGAGCMDHTCEKDIFARASSRPRRA